MNAQVDVLEARQGTSKRNGKPWYQALVRVGEAEDSKVFRCFSRIDVLPFVGKTELDAVFELSTDSQLNVSLRLVSLK